jgi:hypothetical protein
MLRGKIEPIDQALDALVYQLYGLTKAEIKIVEAGRGGSVCPPCYACSFP